MLLFYSIFIQTLSGAQLAMGKRSTQTNNHSHTERPQSPGSCQQQTRFLQLLISSRNTCCEIMPLLHITDDVRLYYYCTPNIHICVKVVSISWTCVYFKFATLQITDFLSCWLSWTPASCEIGELIKGFQSVETSAAPALLSFHCIVPRSASRGQYSYICLKSFIHPVCCAQRNLSNIYS